MLNRLIEIYTYRLLHYKHLMQSNEIQYMSSVIYSDLMNGVLNKVATQCINPYTLYMYITDLT